LARGDVAGPKQRMFDGPAFYKDDKKRRVEPEFLEDDTKKEKGIGLLLEGCEVAGRVWATAPQVAPSRRYVGWLWDRASDEWN
jgi:hypothetical protein